jgi:protein-S-isoprenylcysteine O-methyltransferase Ste14
MIVLGSLAMVASLWVFYRSHKDLGKNWSASLEVREDHVLVTNGVYQSIRHPMYTSIFLLAIAQMFLVPNWIAGPALFTAFSIMFFSRLHTEEKMMLDRFGLQYENYRMQTKRVIPGVW